MTMRYHINLSGTLFVVLTLLVGLAAAQRPNNLVVWGFGVLLAMILVSGVVSAKMVRTLRVTRLETRSASSGSPLMVKYLVENLSRKRSVFALRLGEVLTSRSIKDRFLSQNLKKSGGSYGWLSRIGPGESQVCDSVLPAFRRGVLHLERVRVITAFPFGFIDRRIDFDLDQEILVQPTTHPLKSDLIHSVSQGELGGIGVSARPGPGEDFFSIREFKPGDSIRQIFWKRPQANDDSSSFNVRNRHPPGSGSFSTSPSNRPNFASMPHVISMLVSSRNVRSRWRLRSAPAPTRKDSSSDSPCWGSMIDLCRCGEATGIFSGFSPGSPFWIFHSRESPTTVNRAMQVNGVPWWSSILQGSIRITDPHTPGIGVPPESRSFSISMRSTIHTPNHLNHRPAIRRR